MKDRVFTANHRVRPQAGAPDARVRRQRTVRPALLMCGVLAALCYVGTDVAGGILYSGYSFTDQAVSELFAIGAPTSRLVVPLFTLSSLLLLAFALGVWLSSGHSRLLRVMAAMFAGSALVGMLLWNFFPMHMRGAALTFTDTMHLILARAGDSFFEPPGAHHVLGRNASATEPAKLLAVFVVDSNDKALTVFDKEGHKP